MQNRTITEYMTANTSSGAKWTVSSDGELLIIHGNLTLAFTPDMTRKLARFIASYQDIFEKETGQ